MIRNLLTIGIITGFIAAAFVPPTSARSNSAALSLAPSITTKKLHETTKRVIPVLVKSEMKNTIRSSMDTFAQSQIERIEWAMKKKDIRLCNELASAVMRDEKKNTKVYSAGEYIALCIAMVTKDSARCDQIFSKNDAVLKRFCHDELSST